MTRNQRFAWHLAALCAAAAVLRALLLREYLLENPFAAFPYSDGELYWERAGQMAAGRWFDAAPFLIAPLYLYFLGVLRWLGGDLPALYVVQLALHVATGALVGAASRVRFGEKVGLVAASLFLLLGEPALFATRVLSVTLQLLLVALLWWDWARLARSSRPRRLDEIRVGLWLGLLALAFPAALLLVPVYAAWLAQGAPSLRRGAARAALGSGAALLAISPATIHNAMRSGELIPITAHAGITLAQGNGPGSVGIYTPLADVSTSIHEQHHDVARVFEEEHGRAGSWGEIDAYFRGRVFHWWSSQPADAAALLARKLYWLATARRYDNVAVFSLEREQGLGRSAALVPVELPWLLGAALLGIALARHDPRRALPELALLALPVIVCTVFYYSARYRLVGAPIVCGLAALAIVHWRALRWPRALSVALVLLPLPLLALNAVTGFESLDFMREPFVRTLARHHVRAGEAREARSEPDAAEEHYRRAIRADRRNVEAWSRLYNLQAARGEYAGALETLHGLAALQPHDVQTRLALAWLLASCPDDSLRRGEAAWRHAHEAVQLSGAGDPEALLVLALAEAERARFEEALEAVAQGSRLASGFGDAVLVRNFESLGAHLARHQAVRTAPRLLHVASR